MRFAVIVAAAGIAAASALATVTPPHVSLASRDPVSVRGTHFLRAERVRVTVTAGGVTLAHLVTASATGTFSTRFASLQPGPCAMVWVRATGNRASRATLRLAPECANGPTP
jgi:hypothetical protein